MKTFLTTAAIALSLLTVPAAAQQVRGLEGAIAHINRTQDAPNDRIQIQPSRLDNTNRSTRSGPISRAAEIAFEINNRSADSSTERRVFRDSRTRSQGYSTQRTGPISRAAQIANRIHNQSAETSTDRRIINR